MNLLVLALKDARLFFKPGQKVEGKASWSLEGSPSQVEVRLFWRTLGFGIQEVEVVETARFDRPAQVGEAEFQLPLPRSPFSFEGRLVSLDWGVELVAQPGDHATAVELSMSPTGRPIPLRPSAPQDRGA
jgi:hypothetical protein